MFWKIGKEKGSNCALAGANLRICVLKGGSSPVPYLGDISPCSNLNTM
jgi:hypothetical protein